MKLIIDIHEEMVKALEQGCFGAKYNIYDLCGCVMNGTPYEDKWIPVSERLPEENGEYLVTREAYIDRENRRMIIVRDIAYFTINYGLNNGFHKANRVIAWQSLPESYKEDGAE